MRVADVALDPGVQRAGQHRRRRWRRVDAAVPGAYPHVSSAIIAAAFLVSIPLGIASALAVIAHEIPQEVGDFAILLESGYGRRQLLLLVAGIGTVAWFHLEP